MAASFVLKDNQANQICGLGSFTYTVSSAGPFSVNVMSSVNPASSLSITIAQSGSQSVSVSSVAPSSVQSHIELSNKFNCAVSDVLTVTISSSAAIDEQLNTVESIVVLRAGLV